MQPLRFQGMTRLYTPSVNSKSVREGLTQSPSSEDWEISEPYESAIYNQSFFTVCIRQKITTLDGEQSVLQQDYLTDDDAIDFCRRLDIDVSEEYFDEENAEQFSDWVETSTEEQRRAFVDLAQAYTDRFIENGQLEEQHGGFTSFFSRHDKVALESNEKQAFEAMRREFPADTPHHDKLNLKPEEEQAFEDIMRRYEAD